MRRWVATWAAAIVLAGVPLATASAGWWDDLDKGEPVRLTDLVAQPEAWKGKVVTFACIHHGFDKVYQPYFTSFSPEKWLNVTAWPDGTPLWEMEAFRDQDFPYLYLERTHPQRDELIALPIYTRIEITGRIKDVYRGRPFLEILGFHATPATFGRNVLDWMVMGDRQAAVGDYAKAEANYRLVLAQVTLDESTRLRAQKRLDESLRAAGRSVATDAKQGPVFGGSSMPNPRTTRRGAVPAAGQDPALPPAPFPGGPGGDPFARGGETPVGPIPGGTARAGAAPSELTTTDLPGTPVDAHPGTAAPGFAAPDALPPLPAYPPAGAPPAASPPTGATAPPPVESPAAADGAPACPPTAADAVPPPPAPGTPPPRSPRLSGVR